MKAYLILHSVAKSQKELYLDAINSSINQLNNYSVPQSTYVEIGDFLDQCITNLKVLHYYIDDSLSLAEDVIDIFDVSIAETSLGIASKEDSDPMYLNFFTSRRFAFANSSIIKSFTDVKANLLDVCESFRQTAVIHPNSALTAVATGLTAMVSYYASLMSLKSAAQMAISAYTTYGLTDRASAKQFCNRTFAEIKKDLEILS